MCKLPCVEATIVWIAKCVDCRCVSSVRELGRGLYLNEHHRSAIQALCDSTDLGGIVLALHLVFHSLQVSASAVSKQDMCYRTPWVLDH